MRVFISPQQWTDDFIKLSKDEAHYARHVMRVSVGDEVELFDGVGGVGTARVSVVGRDAVTVNLLDRATLSPRQPHLHLAQALPKGKRMDWIVEKATELGVTRLIPMQTQHVVTQLDEKGVEKKIARWREIAKSATRQSKQAWIPKVEPLTSMNHVLTNIGQSTTMLLCTPVGNNMDLKDVLTERQFTGDANLMILIGPEGDFSSNECQAAKAAGATPVSLGPSVLRTDTAAIFAMSAVRYQFC